MDQQVSPIGGPEFSAEVREVLQWYPLEHPQITFLRQNENQVFLIQEQEHRFVLRLGKPTPGFSLRPLLGQYAAEEYLNGELLLLHVLREQAGFPVQTPVRNKQGELFTILSNGTLASMLTWIEGTPLSSLPHTSQRLELAGQAAAQIHTALKGCTIPARYRYDADFLFSAGRELNWAVQQGNLYQKHAELLQKVIEQLTQIIPEEGNLLVHADLTPSNLLDCGFKVVPIDFSLAGYSRPEMDLASMFCQFPDSYEQQALLSGYRSAGGPKPDPELLRAFCVLQVLLLLVCQHAKYRKSGILPGKGADWCTRVFRPFLEGGKLLL